MIIFRIDCFHYGFPIFPVWYEEQSAVLNMAADLELGTKVNINLESRT